MAGFVDSDALVSAEWLAERLSEPEIRVVDSTWYLPNVDRSGRAEFESGHIPGARYWDIDAIADPNDPRPHMLPGAADFEAHMARLGIGAATRVVVYDRVAMMTAGRVWWMLRYFGHDAVSILDGGFAKWTAEDRPVEQGPVEQGPSAETGAETGAERRRFPPGRGRAWSAAWIRLRACSTGPMRKSSTPARPAGSAPPRRSRARNVAPAISRAA